MTNTQYIFVGFGMRFAVSLHRVLPKCNRAFLVPVIGNHMHQKLARRVRA